MNSFNFQLEFNRLLKIDGKENDLKKKMKQALILNFNNRIVEKVNSGNYQDIDNIIFIFHNQLNTNQEYYELIRDNVFCIIEQLPSEIRRVLFNRVTDFIYKKDKPTLKLSRRNYSKEELKKMREFEMKIPATDLERKEFEKKRKFEQQRKEYERKQRKMMRN